MYINTYKEINYIHVRVREEAQWAGIPTAQVRGPVCVH